MLSRIATLRAASAQMEGTESATARNDRARAECLRLPAHAGRDAPPGPNGRTRAGAPTPAERAAAVLTEKDPVDLDFVAAHADIVGYSLVHTPEDIALLQHELGWAA